MKMFLPVLMLFLFGNLSQAQQSNNGIAPILSDTTSYTKLETALREKGVVHKVEYISSRTIGGVYFGMIVVRNLKTQEVTKGAYIAADSPIRPIQSAPRWDRRTYIDESEFDDLIEYLDSCTNVWKKDLTTSATSYEFETKDKFRFNFAANNDSKTWRFTLEFRNYYFFNKDTFSKARTEEIFDAFSLFRDLLKHY